VSELPPSESCPAPPRRKKCDESVRLRPEVKSLGAKWDPETLAGFRGGVTVAARSRRGVGQRGASCLEEAGELGVAVRDVVPLPRCELVDYDAERAERPARACLRPLRMTSLVLIEGLISKRRGRRDGSKSWGKGGVAGDLLMAAASRTMSESPIHLPPLRVMRGAQRSPGAPPPLSREGGNGLRLWGGRYGR